MLLSPVTTLGRGLEGVSSLLPPSVAHPVRAASRISGRFLTIASREVEGWGWGGWRKETRRPSTPPPHRWSRMDFCPLVRPSVPCQALGEAGPAFRMALPSNQKTAGELGPQPTDSGKPEVLNARSFESQPTPAPRTSAPKPFLLLRKPKSQGPTESFSGVPLRAQLRRNHCSTPQGLSRPILM